ncbi:hypothetical protein HBB16_11350, partial [Pseudonocardia sp. MCCB 268]|nr:hypothetical protein [Pseudonocardia cytotoxica]
MARSASARAGPRLELLTEGVVAGQWRAARRCHENAHPGQAGERGAVDSACSRPFNPAIRNWNGSTM